MTTRMVYKRKSNGNNDFAVAKALNEKVMSIFHVLMMYQTIVTHERFDKDEINRAYIFLVDDLQKIYDKNPELQNIKPEPTWKKFDLLIPMYEGHTLKKYSLCELTRSRRRGFEIRDDTYHPWNQKCL